MTDGGTPLVSVGLPVYNAERYLKLALDSLLGQSFTDFELIVSDNGSNDGTETLCREYADADARIRYYRASSNRGAAWNFNRVFHLARGELFRWAAYDDLCAPTHLERLVAALTEGPGSVVLCYTQTVLIDEDGTPIERYENLLDLREGTAHERLKHLLRELRLANPTYGLMRREALQRTRVLGNYPSADLVMLAELALLGQWNEIPEPLFYRRYHRGMSTRANPTMSQVAEWFDPAKRGENPAEAWRLFREFIVAIQRAPLSPLERLATYATFLAVWPRATRRKLVREPVDITVGRLTRLAAATGLRRAR